MAVLACCGRRLLDGAPRQRSVDRRLTQMLGGAFNFSGFQLLAYP